MCQNFKRWDQRPGPTQYRVRSHGSRSRYPVTVTGEKLCLSPKYHHCIACRCLHGSLFGRIVVSIFILANRLASEPRLTIEASWRHPNRRALFWGKFGTHIKIRKSKKEAKAFLSWMIYVILESYPCFLALGKHRQSGIHLASTSIQITTQHVQLAPAALFCESNNRFLSPKVSTNTSNLTHLQLQDRTASTIESKEISKSLRKAYAKLPKWRCLLSSVASGGQWLWEEHRRTTWLWKYKPELLYSLLMIKVLKLAINGWTYMRCNKASDSGHCSAAH